MDMKVCSTHQNEEEKYFCSHDSCIKLEGNNLVCLECFLNHQKRRSKFHKKIHITTIRDVAKQNLDQYLKLQECTIEKCEYFSQQCEQNLADLLKQITNWINEQSKLIKQSKEQQITLLKKNIAQANEHYKTDKLDQLLYFYKLNLQIEQDISEDFFYQTERYLNFQLKEINMKGQTLIAKPCNMQNIFQAKIIDLKIQVECMEDQKYEKCQLHQAKKNYIFINKNLMDKSNIKLDCLGCLQKVNDIDSGTECIKKITMIQKEQTQKQKKIHEEIKLLQKKIQTSIDKQLESVLSAQKQINESYETQKEQYIQLERDSINKLKQSPQVEYILGNIDFNLLYQSDNLIERQFILNNDGFLKSIKVIEERKPQMQKQFLDIEQETSKTKEDIKQLQQHIDLLTHKNNQLEAKLKDQSLSALCEGINSIQKMLKKG